MPKTLAHLAKIGLLTMLGMWGLGLGLGAAALLAFLADGAICALTYQHHVTGIETHPVVHYTLTFLGTLAALYFLPQIAFLAFLGVTAAVAFWPTALVGGVLLVAVSGLVDAFTEDDAPAAPPAAPTAKK